MSLVGRWPSFVARGHLCASWWIGRLTSFGRPVLFEVVGVVCRGSGRLIVVVAGDEGVWWSSVVVGQLLWFVGGRGCLWWWRLHVGDVVVGGC